MTAKIIPFTKSPARIKLLKMQERLDKLYAEQDKLFASVEKLTGEIEKQELEYHKLLITEAHPTQDLMAYDPFATMVQVGEGFMLIYPQEDPSSAA